MGSEIEIKDGSNMNLRQLMEGLIGKCALTRFGPELSKMSKLLPCKSASSPMLKEVGNWAKANTGCQEIRFRKYREAAGDTTRARK